MKDVVHANWRGAILVCRKCEKQAGVKLARALRRHIGGKARKAGMGVVEVGCLKICPKRAITIVDSLTPDRWRIVPAEASVEDVVAMLGI